MHGSHRLQAQIAQAGSPSQCSHVWEPGRALDADQRPLLLEQRTQCACLLTHQAEQVIQAEDADHPAVRTGGGHDQAPG